MAVKRKAIVRNKKTAVLKSIKGGKPSKRRQTELDKLVLDHRENGRKLARSMLSKWHVRMPADEIDSVVDLTLCETALRFDPTRGASFMTFFFYHLRGHLVRTVTEAAQATNIFLAFAEKTGIDAKEWNTASEQALLAYMPDHLTYHGIDEESPEEILLRKEKMKVCRDSCAHLDALELEVLERSYANDESLVTVSKSLGYSRCHISRVKKRALEKVKRALHKISGEAFIPPKERDSFRETSSLRLKKVRHRKRRVLDKELCVNDTRRVLKIA